MRTIPNAQLQSNSKHPRQREFNGPTILSYGFRPFFLGAGVWSVVVMAVWIGSIVLGWDVSGTYGAVNWHPHEMLFGYTGAALAGFMLTAIPNWTGRLPIRGVPLAALTLIWIAGRVALLQPDFVGVETAIGVDLVFFPLLGLIATREIFAGRNWRNLHIVMALTALSVANGWFHWSVLTDGQAGMPIRLTIGIWMVLISLIGGRLAVSFTRNWMARNGISSFPQPLDRFDGLAILLTLIAVLVWTVWPLERTTGCFCIAVAVVHLVRLLRWRGLKAWREPLVLVLHAAYGFIPFGFIVIGLVPAGLFAPATALHLFTIGAIGLMTVAVMTRASRGHTGRVLSADLSTSAVYICVVGATLSRPVADLLPQFYTLILGLSGLFWVLGFSLFVFAYAPLLVNKRVS